MPTLSSIMSVALLQQMLEEGYVQTRVHPDDKTLVILNYTEKAQFGKVWNEATLQCRGLIVRRPEGVEAMIVARPFPKFFNYGENGRRDYDMFAEVEVTNKMDGSLGILYNGPDGPAIATRGSFDSTQARHATAVYRDRYEGTWMPVDNDTYLFEIVFPANRIVLDYGEQDDLVALGLVDNRTGRVSGPDMVIDAGWRGPATETFRETRMVDALARPPREGAEGLVVTYSKTGEMVKLKQADYVELHKIIFGLNERAVWQRMLDDEATANDINEGLPEEFHPWVENVVDRLAHEYYHLSEAAFRQFDRIMNGVGNEYGGIKARKKAFAAEAVKSDNRGLLFLLYDDKSMREAIFKQIYPPHATYAKEAA